MFFFSTLVLIVSNFIVACAFSRVIKTILTYLLTYLLKSTLIVSRVILGWLANDSLEMRIQKL